MLKNDTVITINRLYGSGGRIMGKRLSEEFDIPFYDEEILTMASEESAIGERFFRLNDEKAGNNLFFRAMGGLHTSLEEPSVDDDITSPENLFRFQAKVIRHGGQRSLHHYGTVRRLCAWSSPGKKSCPSVCVCGPYHLYPQSGGG